MAQPQSKMAVSGEIRLGLVKCTYESCHERFEDEAQMKNHKRYESEHDYCFRCDVDCQDDSELHIHKMLSPRHIACPLCALDFKSESGRELHMRQDHPVNQKLVCPGCKATFSRAHGLMAHIEKGECSGIGFDKFQEHRAKKQVLRAHFKNGLESQNSILRNHFLPTDSGMVTQSGGISVPSLGGDLLDLNMNEAQMRAYVARHGLRTEDTDKLKKPDDQTTRGHTQEDSVVDHGNNQSVKNKTGDLGAGLSKLNINEDSAKDERLTTVATHQQPSKVTDRGWGDVSVSNDENTSNNHHGKGSGLEGYTATKFFDPFQGKFVCPSQKCQGIFDTEGDFNEHLNYGEHASGPVRCPYCSRQFNSTAALLSHCETSRVRCRINQTSNYHEVLQQITGGLIETDGWHDDGSVKYSVPDNNFW